METQPNSLVQVLAFESIDKFYVKRCESITIEKVLIEQLNACNYNPDKPIAIDIDKVYLIKCDLESYWFRVKVTNICDNKEDAEVFFIDHARQERVEVSRLRCCLPLWKSIDPMVQLCQLNRRRSYNFMQSDRIREVFELLISERLECQQSRLSQAPHFSIFTF